MTNKIYEDLKYGDFKFADNGLTYYNINRDETPEEIEANNKAYYDEQDSFIPQIIKDGFIEFPCLFNTYDEEIWLPFYFPPNFIPSCTDGFKEKFGMDFNIYIPTHKRASTSYTFKELRRHGIENVYMVIEANQYPAYKEAFGIEHLIIKNSHVRESKIMDSMSSTQCSDSYRGAASIFLPLQILSRNLGEETYFTMDDDFMSFGIRQRKEPLQKDEDPTYDKDKWLRASSLNPEDINFKEFLGDFGEVYKKIRNRGMMALEKYGLCFAQPFGNVVRGTRCYSCYITSNDRQLDHFSRQNDDIITSMETSKAGYVNLVSETISYASEDTQNSKDGGGMDGVYSRFGTVDKSYCLIRSHPQYTRATFKYNRIHHSADFSGYNKKRLLGEVIK